MAKQVNHESQHSDRQLFQAFQAGSQGAFERLFKQQYPALCAFATGYLHDHDAAEDVVQHCFVNFWQKRESIALQQSLKSYFYTMVRNRCINKLKSVKVQHQHAEGIAHQEEPAAEESEMEVGELADRIAQAIEAMPTERRRIFQMSREEGLKYREIAQKLEISVKTVENQMGKALKYLRDTLSDYLFWVMVLLFL